MSPLTLSSLPSSLTRLPKIPSLTTESPTPSTNTHHNNSGGLLPPTLRVNFRQSHVSPTPKKTYTDPLGRPIVAPPSPQHAVNGNPEQLKCIRTPKSNGGQVDADDRLDGDDGGETNGKNLIARLQRSLAQDNVAMESAAVPSHPRCSHIQRRPPRGYSGPCHFFVHAESHRSCAVSKTALRSKIAL
jgi:hypothetical protein